MMTTRRIVGLIVAGALFLVPAAARAQQVAASINGVVRDASGAVLPGVTVEAASPALIDKVRVLVTDNDGRYRFVDLRPGVYSVSFSLAGFSTLLRTNIELTGGFTATVNGDLSVGGVEQTITVTGEVPLVDLQSVRQQTVLAKDTLDAAPTTGRVGQYVTLIPSAQMQSPALHDVGGLSGERALFGVHGQRADDVTNVVDGVDHKVAGGGVFSLNNLTFKEIAIETSGIGAEAATGGVQVNIVPKNGGNVFEGTFTTAYSNPSLQSENLTDKLRARGLNGAPGLRKLQEFGGSLGGPIKRNRVWFFYAYRQLNSGQFQSGNFWNKRQGEALSVDPRDGMRVAPYEADLSRQAYTDDYFKDHTIRLTWQATTKNRINASLMSNVNCACFSPFLLFPQGGVNAPTAAPEATGQHHYKPNFAPFVGWTFPASDRWLIEAGASLKVYDNTTSPIEGARGVLQVTELATNYRYGSRAWSINTAGGNYTIFRRDMVHSRFAVSYVTGSHNVKMGVERNKYNFGEPGQYTDLDQVMGARGYTFRAGVPESIRLWNVPIGYWEDARDISAFAQDQWTIGRMALNLGLRFNNFNGQIDEQDLIAGRFVPARHTDAVKNSPNWTNFNPRVGVAYDLFGNGRTAVKASWGRYTARNVGAEGNPMHNMAYFTDRSWNDANRNYIPDCELGSPAANGECGAFSDLTFGLVKPPSTGRAPDSLSGVNLEGFNTQTSVSVQHELAQNLALNVGFYHTSYGNFLVTDNRAVTPAHYDEYCITAPVDSRLPGGGGNQLCGLYDIKPTSFGQVDNLVTQLSHYGKKKERYNGVDVTLNGRFGSGGQFSGGLSAGRTVIDACVVVDSPQDARPGFCKVSQPWSSATQAKFLVVYPLPLGFRTSAIYQNVSGIPILASHSVTTAEVARSLGRPLSGGARSVTIDLIAPNTVFEPRLQQLDLRFSRIFGLPKGRIAANFDLYNVGNANAVLVQNGRFGPVWQNAIQVMPGRLMKISAQYDF